MPRYFMTLEYDGGPFCGWQRQNNGVAVQALIEAAVEALCGEAQSVMAAGRTDAGVHARGQVAHVDLPRAYPVTTVRNALNQHLRPYPIAVLEATEVDDALHARFSATARHYRYRICNRRPPLALAQGRAWHVAAALDAERMHEAGQALVGQHDFSSFRATECQAKSPVRTLDRLVVRRRGEEIDVSASARSFLHHQVRNIVGTLALVGKGDWSIDGVAEALHAERRAAAGPTAPAAGLYLDRVDYDGSGFSRPPVG
ncbi:MAG: tRNA pseudouridine(38-40) synthase TruA [Pseudomonadota bacterium]